MRRVRSFSESRYGFLDPERTVEFFHVKYVANLGRHFDLSRLVLLDAGCGQGWLGIAFLLAGGRRFIGVDVDEDKLAVAREFIRILGFDGRTLLVRGSVTALPVRTRSADVVACIETLEHLYGRAPLALRELARVAAKAVIVTTPNGLFPVIAHDTRLPLAHWLPVRLRRLYAAAMGRAELDEGNVFLSPHRVARELNDFRLASRFLGFPSFRAFLESYPQYLPYLGGGTVRDIGMLQRNFYRLVWLILGRYSFHYLPSIAGIFVRRTVGTAR